MSNNFGEAATAFKRQYIFFAVILALFVSAFFISPISLQIDTHPAEVIAIEPQVIKPEVPDFAGILDVQLKKQTFFSYLQPYINNENERILKHRAFLKKFLNQDSNDDSLSDADYGLLSRLSQQYKLESSNLTSRAHIQALLKRIDVLPSSLVLAQAANESAWGASRFAKKGLNFFGQWCYTKGCGIVPSRRRAGANHEVRTFESAEASVHAYFMNLNTFSSYANLRAIRQRLRREDKPIDGISLTVGLSSYSERGDAYVDEIQSMIYSNRLRSRD